MHFGERLKELRERAGLTQEQLADSSGVNLWTIRGYEQGRREPNWKGAIALAVALGVSTETFADCVEINKKHHQDSKPRGRPRKVSAEAVKPAVKQRKSQA